MYILYYFGKKIPNYGFDILYKIVMDIMGHLDKLKFKQVIFAFAVYVTDDFNCRLLNFDPTGSKLASHKPRAKE